MQIPTNSWDCLLIEDTEKDEINKVTSLAVVCGQLSVLFAPISAILFSRLTLVPAIRILYLNASILMTLKAVLLYIFSRETKIGKIRLEETRGKSIFSLASGYGGVLKIIGKSRGTLFAITISITVGIVSLINNTFWPVIVSRKLLVPDHFLPVFPVIRSMVSIIFFFLIMPHLTRGQYLKKPLLLSFGCYFIGQALLILTPAAGPLKYPVLCVSLILDSFSLSLLWMLSKSLIAFHVIPGERARIQAIMNMIVMAATSPFGWIGGVLSEASRNLPFVLNLGVLAAGLIVTIVFYRKSPCQYSQ
jgi:hypothetical protein